MYIGENMDIKRVFQKEEPRNLLCEKRYSILIPIIKIKDEMHIIFEVRSENISQPGEVSLPGGKVEIGETPLQAAKRETQEELKINGSKINIYGELGYLNEFIDSEIRIFVGGIREYSIDDFTTNDEVEYIFTYPISYFRENKPEIFNNVLINSIDENFPFDLIPNGDKYKFRKINREIYMYKNTNPVIWGLTAKIIAKFIEIYEGEINE